MHDDLVYGVQGDLDEHPGDEQADRRDNGDGATKRVDDLREFLLLLGKVIRGLQFRLVRREGAREFLRLGGEGLDEG